MKLLLEPLPLMRFRTLFSLATVSCSLLLFSGFKLQEVESARAIMDQVAEQYDVRSEVALIQLNTTTSDGTLTQRKVLSLLRKKPSGDYDYLFHFIAPKDVEGVTLLTREAQSGSEQFLYLPALGKTKPIKSSQQSQYFMGTDFTFEDLRREQSVPYEYSRQFDNVVEGREVFVILSAPEDKTSGYGSRMLFIDKETREVLSIEYYDDSSLLLKTLRAYDYRSALVDGPSKRPRRAVMTNHQNGSTSVMVLLRSRLNLDLPEDLFNPDTLDQWTPEFTMTQLQRFEAPETP